MLRIHKHHRVGLILVAVLTIMLLFATSQIVQAAYLIIPLTCSPTSVPANVVTAIHCTSASPFTVNDGSNYYCGLKFVGVIEGASLTDYRAWLYADTPENVIDYDNDYHSPDGFGFNYVVSLLGCSSPAEAISPAIWAADLCVGEDGHDADGWLTLDASTANGAYPPTLYVAAGPDGPWYATEFMQPPYVMSYQHTAGLASWMGVASEGALWFKASLDGAPASLASMIADRAAHMDELCSVD